MLLIEILPTFNSSAKNNVFQVNELILLPKDPLADKMLLSTSPLKVIVSAEVLPNNTLPSNLLGPFAVNVLPTDKSPIETVLGVSLRE